MVGFNNVMRTFFLKTVTLNDEMEKSDGKLLMIKTSEVRQRHKYKKSEIKFGYNMLMFMSPYEIAQNVF